MQPASSPATEVDFSLYGDNLQAWRDWLASQEEHEWLLTWAIRANKAGIALSLPLWMLATLLSVPLSLLSMLTGGLLFWPFHWLLVRPLSFLVVGTSAVWPAVPPLRPLLLLTGPLLTSVSMVIISLIPDGNPDHQQARRILCELWPLSSRRLQWIAARGTGRPS